jgi:hypothetical protein
MALVWFFVLALVLAFRFSFSFSVSGEPWSAVGFYEPPTLTQTLSVVYVAK